MKFTLLALTAAVAAFGSFPNLILGALDLSKKNNIAVYWGQNGIYNLDGNRTDRYQKPLVEYCKSMDADAFVLGFLNVFKSKGGLPEVNFANSCGSTKFPGTDLYYCPTIGDDIKACQHTYNKKVLISIGGGSGNYSGWPTANEAHTFADTIWYMFGNAQSKHRPFGDAIVDGFDIDLENGPITNYNQFVSRLRQRMDNDKKATGKQWLLTAAPQCVSPDAFMGSCLVTVPFDAVFVQFYNNPCSAATWAKGKSELTNNGFNFGMWDAWAKTNSFNKKLKVFLSLPMHPTAAATGYVSRKVAASIISDIAKYNSFGGLAAWDASYAAANSAYLPTARNALVSAQSRFS